MTGACLNNTIFVCVRRLNPKEQYYFSRMLPLVRQMWKDTTCGHNDTFLQYRSVNVWRCTKDIRTKQYVVSFHCQY